MATTNHVRISNIPILGSTTNHFRGFWELTRGLKKAGWKYKASSDGTTKETTGDPALDKWNSATAVTNAGAAAASIATPTRGRSTITGLTGIVAADKGRFLVISGGASAANNHWHQIEEIVSSTSVRVDARQFALVSDANNGSLTWAIIDSTTELFSGFATPNAIGWWVAQGPSVLKIPITSASTGTFRRGENLVQATTGAEGQLVGYTYYNGAGWLVVAPRLRGTGSGQHGWDTANLITGSKSGATVTQVGTAIDYVTEATFIKPANQTSIQVFVQTVDRSGESAQLFSVLATSAGCTATVHPGGGGTGNAFPTIAWVMWGTGTTAGTGVRIDANAFSAALVNAHVICVDAIPEQNYSADGSWSLIYFRPEDRNTGYSINDPVNSALLYGFQRLNDTEDGEVSLYLSMTPGAQKTITTNGRTNGGSALSATISLTDPCSFYVANSIDSTATTRYAGWKSRGLTADTFSEFTVAALFPNQSITILQQARTGYYSRMISSANPVMRAREKVWLTGGSARMYKGSFRWLYWVNGGRLGDVFGSDPAWVQLSNGGGTSGGQALLAAAGGGALVVGPHDGTPWLPNLAGG
jgi:hypothetical protein